MATTDFDLMRFLEAHNIRQARRARFENALVELRNGRRKTRRWTHCVFPSVAFLGTEASSRTERDMFYAIKSYREAQAFYNHPVLGPRLETATQAALSSGVMDPVQLFGGDRADAARFKSCLTLFANVEESLGVLSGLRFYGEVVLYFWDDFDEDTLDKIASFDDYPGPYRDEPAQAEDAINKGPAYEPPKMMVIMKGHAEPSEQKLETKPTKKKVEDWEINHILASRVDRRGNLSYQIDWKDGREDDLWYTAASIKYAALQLVAFHDENPDQPGPPCRLDTWWRACVNRRIAPDHPDDDKPAIDRFRSGRR